MLTPPTTVVELIESKATNPCTTNFKKALTAVWTDTENATPISDMVAHEKYMRDTLGYTGALEWNINRTTLNLLLKNKEVKSYVLPVLLSDFCNKCNDFF